MKKFKLDKNYDSLKKEGESGYWFTMKINKKPVHAEKGETPKEAIERMFGEKKENLQDASYADIISDARKEIADAAKEMQVTDRHLGKGKEYRQDTPYKELIAQDNDSSVEFFGEEFKGLRGADAVEKLLKEKRGHIKNAFIRPEIGGIDLVWGNEKGGLMHLIQKRDRLFAKGKGNISGINMARKIPEIMEKGKFNQDTKGRLNIDYESYRIGIMAAFYEKKINWIVTAMELWQ